MITEDYVSFETAKLLKEKGFDERTIYHYTNGDIDAGSVHIGVSATTEKKEVAEHKTFVDGHQKVLKQLKEKQL